MQLSHCVIALAAFLGAVTAGRAADEAWQQKRREALNRPREVIYNNDGNEPVLWPTNRPFSVGALLDMRTTPVAGSEVDTIFYCPISSGFGFLSARIPSADLKLRPVGGVAHLAAYTNVLQQILDMGTDPVRLVSEWCRTNRVEFFISLRVNDTHDQRADQTRLGPPYDLSNWAFSPFKAQHPEMLLGSCTSKPPYCVWSAVDFTHAAVRERFVAMCRDLCTHYDLDGLDLDFLRHMQLFKSVAWGGTASDGERTLLTDVMRQIRAAAESEGRRRGRPILLSVRVPDSVPYCREVGIDLEAWLSEGLVDLVAATSYWQHHPWSYMVELCRKHGVKRYASLDECRLPETAETPLKRMTVATYRARAMAARQAGVDGVLYFNLFTPKQIRNFMWGSPERMRLHDKCYFVSYRGDNRQAGRYLKGGERHIALRELSARKPSVLAPGASVEFPLWIGDDLAALLRENIRPACELVVDASVPANAVLTVTVNGHALREPSVDKRARRYPLQPEQLVCGENRLALSAGPGKGGAPVTLRDAAVRLSGFTAKARE